MPDCNPASLQALAQQLARAADAAQWERVQQLDRLLAQWLQSSARSTEPAMQAAWRALHVVHQRVRQQCALAKDDAVAQLRGLENAREAQQAYAWQEVLE